MIMRSATVWRKTNLSTSIWVLIKPHVVPSHNYKVYDRCISSQKVANTKNQEVYWEALIKVRVVSHTWGGRCGRFLFVLSVGNEKSQVALRRRHTISKSAFPLSLGQIRWHVCGGIFPYLLTLHMPSRCASSHSICQHDQKLVSIISAIRQAQRHDQLTLQCHSAITKP
jgi:hypothetical protein